MTDLSQQTLSFLVSSNHHVAPVLEKYNLDFCCRGKRTLAEACNEKGIDLMKIVPELESALAFDEVDQSSFAEMNPTQLIDDILVPDHDVMKLTMPVIHSHLERVANKHGNYFPYMKQVCELFGSVQKEMNEHMEKEERDLFPGIKEIEKLGYENKPIFSSPDYLPALQTEHENVGTIMFSIRDLTNNYTAPEEACTTFRLSLAELKEFENNLHKHIHIENNILLPKAEKIVDEPKSCCRITKQ